MAISGALMYIRSKSGKNGEQIILQGRCEDGRSFGLVCSDFFPRFFIRTEDIAEARRLLEHAKIPFSESGGWSRMNGGPLLRLDFTVHREMSAAHRLLRGAGLACYEGDISPANQFMIDGGISLRVVFEGNEEDGDRVDLRIRNPRIRADGGGSPIPLRVLALDIETSRTGEIRAVSLVHCPAPDGRISPGQASHYQSVIISIDKGINPAAAGTAELRQHPDETRLLCDLRDKIVAIDPDIITGWNVIGFDMMMILRRMAELGVRGDFGRSRESAAFLPGSGDMPDHCEVPGRVVIDAMRLHRMYPRHFESYSLESVASAVLGRGKAEQFSPSGKMDELDRLWNEEPLRFLKYCLEDSRLVLELLADSGLLELTLRRAALCGTSISRSWASVHAFEQLYTSRLHRERIAAPDHGVDALPMNESPGGTIIFPRSGRFPYVLLLDFKGLYPSIIRSFGIDPLGHVRAKEQGTTGKAQAGLLTSPNGAPFLPDDGILPRIITDFYRLREEAKSRGDETASYAYKILANSFYGVLGSPGCRFAGSDIATAITSFAKEILFWSRDFAAERGFSAMYGDTDSLFLTPPDEVINRANFRPEDLFSLGRELVKDINSHIGVWVRRRWNRESFLEIEFEYLFAPLYIPALKSVSSDAVLHGLQDAGLEGPQGRAKSYAGLGFTGGEIGPASGELVIKGMEAVRSDWTPFARNAQSRLIEALLRDAGREEIAYILKDILAALRNPEHNRQLLISKRLSKNPEEYRGNLPPHVRAARLEMEWRRKKSRGDSRRLRKIRYLMTSEGPRPAMSEEDLVSLIPDSSWYVQKQLIPVLQSINGAASWDLVSQCLAIHPPDGQGELW